MKFSLVLLFIFSFISGSYAQVDREQQAPNDLPALKINSSRLYGKLVDKTTGKGIEAASVQVYLAGSDTLLGGMLTKANGDFNFPDINTGKNIRIVFSAIGYEPFEQVLEKSSTKGRDADSKFEKDLGNIVLQN